MAGGGTGGIVGQGGSESAAQQRPVGFPTWGAGVPRTPGKRTEIVIKPYMDNMKNPFGPGFIMPSSAVQGFEWKVNQQQQFPLAISLIGDNTGRYLATKLTTEGAAAGSPMTRDEAIAKIITDAVGKPGAVLELKKLLDEKQMYGTSKAGKQSILAGDALDGNFYGALSYALDEATAFNAKIAAQQGDVTNPKIYSFEQFLIEAPKSGLYESSSFGGGGSRQTTITHQKFKPEDFDVAIDQLFQQTVGRGATDAELNEFVSKLQAYEKENPQKTVSVKSGDTTNVTQSGGVSSDILTSRMREAALASPEAESYNKATKYLSYFMEALDNPIELG